jgi:translation initiation factor IF-1
MAFKKSFNGGRRRKRSFRQRDTRDQNATYFENAVVIETLPGTLFKVKVEIVKPQKSIHPTENTQNNLTKNLNPNNVDASLNSNSDSVIATEIKEVSNKEKPPIIIICKLKTKLIKKRVMVVKGDRVVVEVNPEDMYFNEEMTHLKGIIIERK